MFPLEVRLWSGYRAMARIDDVIQPWCIVNNMTAPLNADVQARKRTLVDALYRKYKQALTRFLARRHLSREEVADIVQETYCRMHQVSDVESIEFPKAFLFRVANNLARNAEKHRRIVMAQGIVDTDSIELPTGDPSPYRILKGEQELALIRSAFQELSPKCRRVFVMNRFENLRYPEIAKELDISVSMVEKYVSQALARLKTRLAEIDPAADTLRLLK